MQGFTFRRTALAAVSVGLLAACDRSDTLTSPAAAPAKSAKIALELSDLSASAGSRIAVSLANESITDLGGLQGTLRYNTTQLRYVGQIRDNASDEVVLVNAKGTSRGELTVAVVDPTGIERSQSLIFEVLSPAYAGGIEFVPTEAVRNGAPVQLVQATMANDVQVNRALVASGTATQFTVQDWVAARDAQHAADPGEIRAGLKFGDANLDGSLTLADGLYIINVGVGANEMIIGTDGRDASGNYTAAADRDAVVAGNVFPANGTDLGEPTDVLPPGVESNGTRVLSLADGLAIINESVGNNQPVVGEFIPGRPSTPVTNRVIVTGAITTNTTWTKNNIYELVDEVIVTGGATLTIQAGTRIEGAQGVFVPASGGNPASTTDGSAFYVARDGKINAVGTPLEPIVWTCKERATAPTRYKGCWGGVSILGNASSNRADATNPTSPVVPGRDATGGCKQAASEGRTPKFYGGCNDDDNSGIMQYNVIDYAGFRFTVENELNGLALYGVGRGTTIDHIQVHAGLDDGIEFFGGTVNVRYIYLTANSDDSFDFTESWSGNAQFVIAQHDSLDSDKGIEMDNNQLDNLATPSTKPWMYNFTVVGKAVPTSTSGTAGNNSVGGFHLRRGAWPKMYNMIVQNFPFAADIDDAATCTGWGTSTGAIVDYNIFTQNARLDDPDADAAISGCGTSEATALQGMTNNQFPATSPVISPLNVMVPDFRTAFGTAKDGIAPLATPIGAPAGFLDVTATFRGAVEPANASKSNIPWYAGWTHGWATPSVP